MLMFDFLKDLYFEMNDFDMDKIKEEKKMKIEIEKSETILFKKKTKIILLVVGILLMLVSIATLIICINKSSVGGILKNSFLILIDLITMITLMIKKKETEVLSLVGMVLIVAVVFGLPML